MKLKKDSLTLKDAFYPALQSHDFYTLSREKNIAIQLGGQDQWGNITTGIEYIRKKQENLKVGAITIPLLTDSQGHKFGKSGGNTLFLSEKLSSSYSSFQYFYNLSDSKIRELANFIFSISPEEILSDNISVLKEKVIRELFTGVYSAGKFEKIRQISQLLFSQERQDSKYSWTKKELDLISEELPIFRSKEALNISSLLINLKFSSSHSESKRLVEEDKCIFCFGERVREHKKMIPLELLKHSYLLIRKGEKEFGLFQLLS